MTSQLLNRATTWTSLALAWLRRRTRSSELWLIAVAVVVGMVAGALAVVQAQLAHAVQILLFAFDPDQRLSEQTSLTPWRALFIPLGGLVLGVVTWLWTRRGARASVDPVEANALHGGRMSIRDSTVICTQTLISNGCGASVGLEAAYAQAGGAVASFAGQRLNLRRADLRTLVGAGAGAAIAAAFGAPLTGAFYAFEVVIGAYTVANIAPVAAATLTAVLVARSMDASPYLIRTPVVAVQSLSHYALYSLLGLVAAGFGILMMRAVATAERAVARTPINPMFRPAVGGLLLAGFALVTPQTLSAGHGALILDLQSNPAIGMLIMLLAFKAMASIVSLSFGFRGGLFFAALFLGMLCGQLFAAVIALFPGAPSLDPVVAGLVGMGALGVAIVGGPFTMSFVVLEATRDFSVTAATLVASLVASTVVRETFGYSFSTWRLHLRGETIRSAHDVGWIRSLTAGKMMRKDAPAIGADSTLAEFRRRYPLGSTKRVMLLDEAGRYAGMVHSAAAFSADLDMATPLADLAVNREDTLSPDLTIKEIMTAFDASETDALAVIDADRTLLGVLTEAHATRRYAEELEKARRDLTGEG